MKISKPPSLGESWGGWGQPRDERRSWAKRSEWVHSGERRSENKKGSTGRRKQGGNWSRWISGILLLCSLRRVFLVVVAFQCQLVSKKSRFLFIHELGVKGARRKTFHRGNPTLSRTEEARLNRSNLANARPRRAVDEKLLSAVVITRDTVAPAAVQIIVAVGKPAN